MFLIHSVDDGHVPSHYYMEAAAITPKVGLALVPNSSGQLAVASGTTAPEYICMQENTAAVEAGTVIPVIRVDHRTVYETTCNVTMSGVKLGNKVTISSDGLQVTATTTSGVAEVVGMEGTYSGSRIQVRF